MSRVQVYDCSWAAGGVTSKGLLVEMAFMARNNRATLVMTDDADNTRTVSYAAYARFVQVCV